LNCLTTHRTDIQNPALDEGKMKRLTSSENILEILFKFNHPSKR
jgi:hypothetical protein